VYVKGKRKKGEFTIHDNIGTGACDRHRSQGEGGQCELATKGHVWEYLQC